MSKKNPYIKINTTPTDLVVSVAGTYERLKKLKFERESNLLEDATAPKRKGETEKKARERRRKTAKKRIALAKKEGTWNPKPSIDGHSNKYTDFLDWLAARQVLNSGEIRDLDKIEAAKRMSDFNNYSMFGVNYANGQNPYINNTDDYNKAASSFEVTKGNMRNFIQAPALAYAGFTYGPSALITSIAGAAAGKEGGEYVSKKAALGLSNIFNLNVNNSDKLDAIAEFTGGFGGAILGGGAGFAAGKATDLVGPLYNGSKYVINKAKYNPITLSLAMNKDINSATVPTFTYITPKGFNRFKLGDVEINNPSLYYRQGSTQMGEAFLNKGIVEGGGGYENPMYAKGKLWYGKPTEEMLKEGRQLKVGRFNLRKDNEAAPKTDLLVSSSDTPMVPADQHSKPKKWITTKEPAHPYNDIQIKQAPSDYAREFMEEFNKKYYNGEVDGWFNITRAGTEDIRRVPLEGTANKSNTILYRYDPNYGYRKISDFHSDIIRPFETPLVDEYGNLTQSIDDILNLVKERIPFAKNSEDLINKGIGGKTNLKEHIEAVVKSAQEYPLPEGVTRQDFVTSALYHDLGKLINSASSHGNTSNYVVNLMDWITNNDIVDAVRNHMNLQEFFNTASKLTKALHAADVGRGQSYGELITKFPYLKYEKYGGKLNYNYHI